MPDTPHTLELENLTAVFQPIVSLSGGSILGYEGSICGAEGSAFESAEQLFERARTPEHLRRLEIASITTVLKAFGALGLRGKLFLNVAPVVLRLESDPLEKIVDALGQAGMTADQVVIEVTENQPMLGVHPLYEVLRRARAIGFEVAIDDLGEGFASLRVWSDLQPEYVKIDKHFVQGLNANPRKFQFVRTIRQLSEVVGTKVIGDGVALEEELQLLRDLGVEYGQGPLLGAAASQPALHVESGVRRLIRAPRAERVTELFQSPRSGASQVLVDQLVKDVDPLSPTSAMLEARLRFEADRELLILPVVDREAVVGILRREAVASPQGKAADAPEAVCVQALMESAPLVVDSRLSLEEVSVLLAQTHWRSFAQPFIVTERGLYKGLCNAQTVLREFTRFQSRALRNTQPLTALPGPTAVQEALENLLEKKLGFVAVLCDINHLRAYNEVFGYPRGDNLIKYTAIVVEAYCDPRVDFLGHLGGGTFLLMIRSTDWRERCAALVDQFNLGRQAFLAKSDIAQGGYTHASRRGEPVFESLPSLSVGAVVIGSGQYGSTHEIIEATRSAAAEAKKVPGGSLFIERRRPERRFRVGFEPDAA